MQLNEILGKRDEKEKLPSVNTSSLSNENTQHFYRKLGYKDSGCLLLKFEPSEIIFTKEI